MPATGALQRHTGVQQRQGRRADRAHRRRAVGARAPRTPGGSRTGTPRGSAAPARARARRASRARSRDASGSRRGRSHRSSTAGSCSGACSACSSPATSESICCSILSMFSVVTPRIWVSPRWKIAEPWTRGMTAPRPTADGCRRGRGRRCGTGRAGSRCAHQLLGQRPERGAELLLAALEVRPDALEQLGLDLVGALVALLLAGDAVAPGRARRGRCGFDGVVDVVLVGGKTGIVGGRLRASGRRGPAAPESCVMNGFEASRPSRDDGLGRRRGAALDQRITLSVASASTIMIATSAWSPVPATTRPATTRSNTASSSCSTVGNATHWSAIELADQRDARTDAGRRTAGRRSGSTPTRR